MNGGGKVSMHYAAALLHPILISIIKRGGEGRSRVLLQGALPHSSMVGAIWPLPPNGEATAAIAV